MSPPDYNYWFIGIIYIAPYLIGFIMPGRKTITYCLLCFLVYDLSWRFMPAGFILPWFLIPFAGALKYFPFHEPVISKRLFYYSATLSIFFALFAANYLLVNAPVNIPSIYIFPTFISGVFSGSPYYFNTNGYFLGLWIESIIILTYCFVTVLAIFGVDKGRAPPGRAPPPAAMPLT